MLEKQFLPPFDTLRAQIDKAYQMNELTLVKNLCNQASIGQEDLEYIKITAAKLVESVRLARKKTTGIDSFLTEFALTSQEGLALMCLAEAFLRVPDKATIDSLIKDKLVDADWKSHKGQSQSFFVNATTWALILTGKILSPEKAQTNASKAFMKLLSKRSALVLRTAIYKAMGILSKQFVIGPTITNALIRAKKKEDQGYQYSFDMLGEAALTAMDAERFFNAYKNAIETIGKSQGKSSNINHCAGVSIKLSALHPRYSESQQARVMSELPQKVLALAQIAKRHNISLTLDAEESERLEISLDIFEQVFTDDSLRGWHGFGLALQTYQKRAYYILDWVAALARSKQDRVMVRLIKGAYWDSEIKKTQMQGLAEYPVFTRKVFTDVSFQACAKKILTMADAIYPQFATHNAYSVAMILTLVRDYKDYEFQCLYGMGTELYEQVVPEHCFNRPCRIYAPVGSNEELLPYLVRRLLENGANSSFVNRIMDDTVDISSLIQDPISQAVELLSKDNLNIPLPEAIFLPERINSKGFDINNRFERQRLEEALLPLNKTLFNSGPIIGGHLVLNTPRAVHAPQQVSRVIGFVQDSTFEEVEKALTTAQIGFKTWGTTPVSQRADCLYRFADLLQSKQAQLLALLCLEGGKTRVDSLSEIREAIDFCRYYALKAQQMMAQPCHLKGYTGELNELSLHPRGIVLCISPWNFPLAIFVGQVVAGLATGNCVIAKPAEQTPLIATLVTSLLHEAGIPGGALQLLPGPGDTIGKALVEDRRIKAVLFTGSTATATHINQALAARGGEIIPLIAETGGQNAMIVDSSALLEQVVNDVMGSAFGSAGQRCSAVRVLFVQAEVYDKLMQLLKGAMCELVIGDPYWFATDVGPVIDKEALSELENHVIRMMKQHTLLYQCELSEKAKVGFFMPPTILAIDSMSALEKEVFGPILHVISYQSTELDKVITQINSSGFGLTLGIHSRINATIDHIRQNIHVGNCYVNRNVIGAVVGLQPFGGEGLSGTGPKAGGPNYLLRLCHERTFTVDTTAAGGNASLMSMADAYE
ncbi:MAG: bifunctional proline dehydrogenase/L-glutamate gamma-semialdehyde dehydrogenase PutA [Legionella sp.]|nr:bifunctional proline dehydrogenase/L-glutamate gamma-semialdehyde dehydrogenase PutA [Legionella sp.]